MFPMHPTPKRNSQAKLPLDVGPAPNEVLVAALTPGGGPVLEWEAAATAPSDTRRQFETALMERYRADAADGWLWLGFADRALRLSPSLEFWRRVGALFVEGLRRLPDLESLREKATVAADPVELEALCQQAPAAAGSEYLNVEVLRSHWAALNEAFARRIGEFDGSVCDYFRLSAPHVHLVGRVYFHLVENKGGELPFAFMATYTTGMDRQGQTTHLPLRHALEHYGHNTPKLLELLATVHRAARQSPVVARLLESGALFSPLAWSPAEAWEFLNAIEICEEAGIMCRIPDWWQRRAARVRVKLRIGENRPSLLGLDTLLNLTPALMVGDTPIDLEEARRLLAAGQGLALIKNRWVAVDPDRLRQTLDAYEKALALAERGGLSLREAMRLMLRPEAVLDAVDLPEDIEVTHGRWLAEITEKLKAPERIEPVTTDSAFQGQLRPYQHHGLAWLDLLGHLGLGACLADDMGLGKTVQVLALLSRLKAARKKKSAPARPHLLVVPASLMANWLAETARFCGHFKVFVAHPEGHGGQPVPEMSAEDLSAYDLVLTTYSLVGRYPWLRRVPFDTLILDEAQAIKNPTTRQTRAVKQLQARTRLALTGTPIENRLSDLWSLFDFLNPGLLGSAAEFKRFVKDLDRRPEGYARLRRVVGPYILRRMKTDRRIIDDLPDKVEMTTFAELGKRQIVLYHDLVADLKTRLENAEDPMGRRGLVLAALMKFKQICNHPDQYLGSGAFAETDSGKFARLREICETIRDKRERVLVFTQFKEMTEPLAAFLETIFGRPGKVLHGGVPVGKRRQIVADFQGAAYVPFMVLSLKAGGTGLNLTAANHVIHFDRWWNPAVENQATDRAYRIGQHRNVVVHKFVTRRTVEEKIDAMLKTKTELVDKVIAPTGEAWITEMDNAQLVDLFRLSEGLES
jgi:non-specific serine/threonine protein kinase